MSSKFIAAVVAAAVTITAFGASSLEAQQRKRHHDNHNAELITGIAALIALGILLSNDDSDERTVRPVPPTPTPRPLPPGVARYELPKKCVRRVETRNGTKRMFGRHCLRKNYRWVRELPRRCERQFHFRGKVRNGFAAKCLRRHGYKVRRG